MMIQTMQVGLFDGADDAPGYRWEQQRADEEAGAPLSEVSILSHGMGQDSTYLFHRLWYDDEFRQTYAPGRLYIVHADTGDEHPETYEHVERIKRICWERNWEFVHITADMGFHLKSWESLMGQMYRNDTIMGTGFPRSCTDNLKLSPIYKWLAYRLSQDYAGVPDPRDGKVFQAGRSFRAFVERYGRVRMILGIAAGEERRMYGTMGGWRQQVQVRQYPMVYDGIDRLAAIEAIQGWGEVVPPPSHCMRCHFQGPQQLLLLSREHPDKWQEWVERERAKIDRCQSECDRRDIPNYGVFGLDLLPQVLYDAEAKYGHLTTHALREYAFTRSCSLVSY